jgi:hypothetical protein
MRVEILKCTVAEVTQPATLPDGRYEAIWAEYQISWRIESRSFIARTGDGVRGFVKGFVIVDGGEIRFEK